MNNAKSISLMRVTLSRVTHFLTHTVVLRINGTPGKYDENWL